MPKRKKINKQTLLVRSKITPLVLILASILLTFAVSRIITYMVLVVKTLPPSLFLDIGGFRLHHFVYGNAIITITSFLSIGLGIRKHKNLFAVFYGIGLGLVLDEFLLWVGDVKQLTSNVMWIPHSFTAISIASLIIATIVMFDLYEISVLKVIKKHGKK